MFAFFIGAQDWLVYTHMLNTINVFENALINFLTSNCSSMHLTVVDFGQWTFCVKWELDYTVRLNVIAAQIHQFSCLLLKYNRFHDGFSQKTKSFKPVVSWSLVHNLSMITKYVITLNWSDGQWWSLIAIPMDLVQAGLSATSIGSSSNIRKRFQASIQPDDTAYCRTISELYIFQF